MRFLKSPLSEELLDILNPYSDWILSQDLSKIKVEGDPTLRFPTTETSYLVAAIDEDVNKFGFPRYTYGIDLSKVDSTPSDWRDKIVQLDKDLNNFLGSAFCAVKMYYPKGGYMSWHHNANCPGYNILLSYSQNGDGYFRFRDPSKKGNQIVTMQDPVGWSAKVGYFGSYKEPDKIYWHCASSTLPRLTLGFVIPDKGMWEMMCDDIED